MKFKELSSYKNRINKADAHHVNIKLLDVGGLGCSFVKYYLDNHCSWSMSSIYAVDSDLDGLLKSMSPYKIQLGESIANGLSTNGDINFAKKSIIESYDRIVEELQNTNIILIYTALGGGIGSGVTPEIIKIAKKLGIYCVSIASIPSTIDSHTRGIVKESLKRIKEFTDAYIVLDNNKILKEDTIGYLRGNESEKIKFLSQFIIDIIGDELRFEEIDEVNNKLFYRRICDSNFSDIINELKNDDDFWIAKLDGVEIKCK